MKTTNLLKLTLGITSFGLLGGAIASGYSSKYISKDQTPTNEKTGKVDAVSAFGCTKGTISFSYTSPDNVTITDYSDFLCESSLNWGGGHFTVDGTRYTITGFGPKAMAPTTSLSWNFVACVMTIPATVKKLDHECFQKNSSNWGASDKELIGINFEEGVEEIGYDAFWRCNDIMNEHRNIKLPNSLKYIGHSAFQDCNLTGVDLSSVDHIITCTDNPTSSETNDVDVLSQSEKTAVFYENEELTDVYVYSKAVAEKMKETKPWKTSGEKGKVNVTTIDIPAINFGGKSGYIKVEYDWDHYQDAHIIGHSNDFMAVNKFDFNGGHVSYNGHTYTITEIESNAFEKNAGASRMFYNCDLVLPSTITKIESKTFACSFDAWKEKTNHEFRSITFPSSITTIGYSAFMYCTGYKYGAITFPDTIQTIEDGAFLGSQLGQINLYKLTHTVASTSNNPKNMFGDNIQLIYVYNSSLKNSFLNLSSSWKSLSDIVIPVR